MCKLITECPNCSSAKFVPGGLICIDSYDRCIECGIQLLINCVSDVGAVFLKYPEELRMDAMDAQLRREMLRVGRVYGHFC